ncbi:proton myo-inositol cotransporter [Trichinella spiralis]|uniref:proton myo-inositol cotransporter n=1 Tax=Trichinella spiralis TaxID=6334 RepID=UPI0001EFBB42|nr:proton myo-inositol cotransporter [Trichinella spiralis]
MVDLEQTAFQHNPPLTRTAACFIHPLANKQKMQLIDEVDTDQEDGPLGKRRISSTMHMATMFAALGGLLFGFHTGGISSAMVAIKQKIQLDHFWQVCEKEAFS